MKHFFITIGIMLLSIAVHAQHADTTGGKKLTQFVVIPEAFAKSMQGIKSSQTNDVFNYAVTSDGRYVVAANAVDYYAEYFIDIDTTTILLSPKDFPNPNAPKQQ